MTSQVLAPEHSLAPSGPGRGSRVAIVAVAVLVVALAIAGLVRARLAADADAAALARHQSLALSAYAGLQDGVSEWWSQPAGQRDAALLTGSAHVGPDSSIDVSGTSVRTEVLRTSPDLALRLTVVSNGHSTVLWQKQTGNASDTCSTNDAAPSTVDCEAWVRTPLTG
jgi:hypothetical protein